MPNWREVLQEIELAENSKALDLVRRKYLKEIFDFTGRNVIAYYSGWLQRPNSRDSAVNDKDISGFMLNIHKLDKTKGLDLILHTPGGNIAATEALVTYLKSMFNGDVRAIIPQLSMSAGTMIALSAKSVMMGKHSSMGPIDPQFNGMPCQEVLKEFEAAKKEIIKTPQTAHLWQFIISKYHPTFLSECQHAIKWSEKLVVDWLKDNMCKGDARKARKIMNGFSDHSVHKTHSRHISPDQCKKIGVEIEELESDDKLQDLILTAHHAFMHTFANTTAVKIIENHLGMAYVEQQAIPSKTS